MKCEGVSGVREGGGRGGLRRIVLSLDTHTKPAQRKVSKK